MESRFDARAAPEGSMTLVPGLRPPCEVADRLKPSHFKDGCFCAIGKKPDALVAIVQRRRHRATAVNAQRMRFASAPACAFRAHKRRKPCDNCPAACRHHVTAWVHPVSKAPRTPRPLVDGAHPVFDGLTSQGQACRGRPARGRPALRRCSPTIHRPRPALSASPLETL